MQETYTPLDTDLLLAQTAWVRKLARSLVRDPAGADDVAQETLLAALKAPPHDATDVNRLRAWLGRVAYNISHLQVRRSVRRRAREERVARDESQDSTADTFVRDSTLRLVTDAVHSLEEPYRTTVRQRYFHGRSTADIAAHMGTTDNAVRKRLWRARQKLRTLLDAEHNGDRMAWFNALAPLAGVRLDGAPASAVAKGSAPSFSQAGWAAGALASAAAVALVVGTVLHDGGRSVAPDVATRVVHGEPAAAALASVPAGRRLASVPDATRSADALGTTGLDARTESPESFEANVADERTGEPQAVAARVRGRVVDLDGNPLAGLAIVAPESTDEVLGWSALDGRFELDVVPPIALRAQADGFAPLRQSAVETWNTEREHVLVAAPSIDVAGLALDDEDRPLEGVAIRLGLDDLSLLHADADRAARLITTEPVDRTCVTDADGRFRLAGIATGGGAFLEASGLGLRAERVAVPPASTDALVLRLARATLPEEVLAGVVVSDAGHPVAGARVSLGAASTRSDEDGAFSLRWRGSIDPRTPLVARKEGFEQVHAPLIGMVHGDDPNEAHVRVGLVLAQRAFTLSGRVLDADGEPCAGWFCWAAPGAPPAGAEEWLPLEPGALPMAVTNANGEYELRGLARLEYVVHAFDPSTLIQTTPVPADPAADEPTDLNVPAGTGLTSVRGRVVARDGRPLTGSLVTAALPVQPLEAGHAFGVSARTDALGWFELAGVPQQPIELRLRTANGPVSFHDVAPESARAAIELCAPQWMPLEVALGDAYASADAFAVFDADGKALAVRGPDGARSHGRLFGGQSPVYYASEEAAMLVVYLPGQAVPADLDDATASADDGPEAAATTAASVRR